MISMVMIYLHGCKADISPYKERLVPAEEKVEQPLVRADNNLTSSLIIKETV